MFENDLHCSSFFKIEQRSHSPFFFAGAIVEHFEKLQ
jgi:hypothetical protein